MFEPESIHIEVRKFLDRGKIGYKINVEYRTSLTYLELLGVLDMVKQQIFESSTNIGDRKGKSQAAVFTDYLIGKILSKKHNKEE